VLFTETSLRGAYIIDVNLIEDNRGFFGRSYCEHEFSAYGLNTRIVQTNISHNKIKGTLRGMHMQLVPYAETKVVRCTKGAIYDVIIDLRESSATYKQWIGVELTAESFRMLYVPEGFAHGFITLENNTDVSYQVSQFYTPGYEKGYRWDDPAFDIDWPIQPVVISERDKTHALLDVPFHENLSHS
jgi:dTDP-4-dehydrorhamnose 3,5-epimerase